MRCQHRLNLSRDELPIVRMHERDVLLEARRCAIMTQAMNREQLGRPVLETRRREPPASGVREPLRLH
jgi:hypothetical protein